MIAPPTSPGNSTHFQNTTALPSTPIPLHIPDLPDYALEYAPIVYLDEKEEYFPSSLDVHFSHTLPYWEYQPLNNVPSPLTLSNLDFENNDWIYYSVENPAQEPRPDWYYSTYGKPNSSGFSGSNMTVIAVNKTDSIGKDVVDVFYFLFYSFNLGQDVGGQRYGNHISDIEHIMIRFHAGQPKYIFLSQHSDGQAYDWSSLQKEGDRPIAYSARGGHANYPVAGVFSLVKGLEGMLEDHTSPGWRWDLMQNYNAYWYSSQDGFAEANGTKASTWSGGPPDTGFLKQAGRWGNRALKEDDPSQFIILGQSAWGDGAAGPISPNKGLARTWLCITSNCKSNAILPASFARQAIDWTPIGRGSTIRPPMACLSALCVTGLAMIL